MSYECEHFTVQGQLIVIRNDQAEPYVAGMLRAKTGMFRDRGKKEGSRGW